jgi:hypothetical protein
MDYRTGPIAWPAQSPDVSLLVFFVWGYVKNIAYLPPLPQDIDDLKDRIQRADARTKR